MGSEGLDPHHIGGLELTTLVPVGILGPTLGTRLSTSVEFIQSMLAGAVNGWLLSIWASSTCAMSRPLLQALTTAGAAGERILLSADSPAESFRGIARFFREGLGSAASKVPCSEYREAEVRELARTLREALSRLGRRPETAMP